MAAARSATGLPIRTVTEVIALHAAMLQNIECILGTYDLLVDQRTVDAIDFVRGFCKIDQLVPVVAGFFGGCAAFDPGLHAVIVCIEAGTGDRKSTRLNSSH